jgi:D-sedoheptulose 7-phosphate isomerase
MRLQNDAVLGLIRRRLEGSIRLKQALLSDDDYCHTVAEVSSRIVAALCGGGKLMLFGNGGSAADAQHIAAEMTGRYLVDRSPWPALALTVNTSTLTAIGNDYGYEHVFARQLQALGKPGDIACGISTSGTSPNVLRAFETAREKGIVTVAMTGHHAAQVRGLVDYCLCVPSDEIPRIQEVHIFTGHLICELVEHSLIVASAVAASRP